MARRSRQAGAVAPAVQPDLPISSSAASHPDVVPVTQTAPTAPPASAAPIVPADPKPAPPATVKQAGNDYRPAGLEVVDRADLVIPRIGILQAQPAQKLDTKPGVFYDRLSGELHKELTGVVPLKFTKGRVFFKDMEEGGGVLCASDDRIQPAARIEQPVQASCAGCPRSLWSAKDGKRVPPDCQETWTLLAIVHGMPYFLTFKSGAMKATKKLLTQLTLTATKERRDAFGYAFDIATELVTYPGGTTAYQPVFKNLRKIKEPEYQAHRAMYDAFAHVEPTFDEETPGGGGAGGPTDEQLGFAFGAAE